MHRRIHAAPTPNRPPQDLDQRRVRRGLRADAANLAQAMQQLRQRRAAWIDAWMARRPRASRTAAAQAWRLHRIRTRTQLLQAQGAAVPAQWPMGLF